MTTHKVSELEGALLDAAVAKAEGYEILRSGTGGGVWRPAGSGRAGVVWIDGPAHPVRLPTMTEYRPSTSCEQAGQIIERERIDLEAPMMDGDEWGAVTWPMGEARRPGPNEATARATGPTHLIAAMRAYVASKFGDTVELP